MDSTKKKRIEWLDSLRGFAMFFVVLGHIAANSSSQILLIYSFHMPLFFMISGATFRAGKYSSFLACVKDKAKKLLLPYVFLYLINIPFWYLNKKILGTNSHTLDEVLWGIVPANQSIETMSSGALWFLPALFLISVVFYGMVELDRKGKLKLEASVLICFLLMVYLSLFYGKATPWHWAVVPMGIIFYFLGWAFIQNKDNFLKLVQGRESSTDIAKIRFIVVGIALLAFGIWAAYTNGKISMHGNSYNTIALALISSTFISLALTMLMMKLPKIKLLDYAGKNSIIFFGFHIALIRFLENWSVTDGFAASHVLATALIVFVAMVPVSMFVNRFCPFIVMKKRQPKKA